MPEAIQLHWITDGLAYWILFWTLVNALLPPRETFAAASDSFKARYETVLRLVAHYGALDIRQKIVNLYPSVKKPDPPQAN